MTHRTPKLLRRLATWALPDALIEYGQLIQSLPFHLGTLDRKTTLLAEAFARQGYSTPLPEQDHLPEINRHELCVHSQNGEDGILLYLFSKIGTTNRRFVEFGTGDGTECNTANLALNFGWGGLLMESHPPFAKAARSYYARVLRDRAADVVVLQAKVTAENINTLLKEHGPEPAIDLLSIDIDGNDYWVWKAVEVVEPRVVVIEYNAAMGYEKSITVEYDPDFERWAKHPSGLYAGASLPALTKLANKKGYRLVGCDRHGVNAFFVRRERAEGVLAELTPEQAYFPLQDRKLGLVTPDSFARIADMPFDRV